MLSLPRHSHVRFEDLAGVDISRSDSISADESMVDIDADAVLVTVVTNAVLFCPASTQIFLLQAIWVFIPTLRQPICFDFIILIAGISLPRYWDKSCIDDLTTTGL
jgi:hypothetical protein